MTKAMMKYVDETREYVLEVMTNEYGFDETSAKSIIKKSSFSKLLDEDPLYVMHFNAEYWVEKMLEENERIRQISIV